MKKRVVVAMSGGVDSSVVAALLKSQGYECIGMHLEFWEDEVHDSSAEEKKNKCCTLEGLEDARHVARKLDIPFYVMNVVKDFKEKVVDYYLDTYAQSKTPNPCVQCNTHIKFGQLLNRAKELDADYLATGHYAKLIRSENDPHLPIELHMAGDRNKDQSYFIYHLGQEKLKNILFPLGDMLKSEVYELAKSFGLLRVTEKKESQGLCFFAESKPVYFLKRHLPEKLFRAGSIFTLDGREIGTHRGLPLYTIGQRNGLGIGGIAGEPEGEPWYVVRIDADKNALIVGRKSDALQQIFVCSSVSFVSGEEVKGEHSAQVRIRHRGKLEPCRYSMREDGFLEIKLLEPTSGIAPGQSAVLYEGDIVLGGGVIENVLMTYDATKEKRGLSITH